MKTAPAGWFLVAALLAGLLMASFAIAQKDDQAEVLMQAAHQKQLVEGHLEEAIQLYKRIVQEHSGNHAVAAQALLEMASATKNSATRRRERLTSACCATTPTKAKRPSKLARALPCFQATAPQDHPKWSPGASGPGQT